MHWGPGLPGRPVSRCFDWQQGGRVQACRPRRCHSLLGCSRRSCPGDLHPLMVRPMRRLGRIAFAVLGAAVAVSCYVETLTIEETDLVITVRDPEADYSSLRTYALTDTITDL